MSKTSFAEVRALFRMRDPHRWFWFRDWLKGATGPMLKDALRIVALAIALYALGLTFGKGFATGLSQSFQLNVRLQVSE
ncbi:hypothetical protein N7414_15855 [Pseudomonas sp. GD04087]|uniref:hypothetical protein n=1 Tax=unclassified Pseudomonas TaxID=196821 RepID=UPI002446F0E5|nr:MULTISPECIES: hypothetical protein [unclassified Pseudomonas]MDH0290599.1 hypothetical protein [Pseudomonas sp. GD04087]MDH1051516.1 hypothetical protein [Pseudomonas sp. GD03903]MDH2002757.1 hypothetical protein [Pseudomonas sp. GD03691]